MHKLEELRKSFRPDRITTLFVGESAPNSGRFFYSSNSSLFHAMKKAFGGQPTFLEDFKMSGCYLDDLVGIPVNKLANKERSALRWDSVPHFAERLREYRPKAIVIVMRAIKPMVLEAMRMAGYGYEPHCTPHPAYGNTNHFHAAMNEILNSLPATGATNWKDITE
jgi:hypothetical protein